MKQITLSLLSLFTAAFVMAQAPTSKIILSNGQKITVDNTLTLDATVMGMTMTNSSTNTNILEVKSSNDKTYTISNTMTKVKTDMNAMGQAQSYDSDKDDPTSDIGKAVSDRLNKPEDIILDNTTGDTKLASPEKKTKKADDDAEPMDGLMNLVGDNSADALVSAAFEIIPAGKKVGDTWSDTSATKDIKTIRNYKLESITGDEATISMTANITANTTINFQEMEMNLKSTTVSTGQTITDIRTGKVKKKTSSSDINGTIQLMGQDVPINAKATTSTNYN